MTQIKRWDIVRINAREDDFKHLSDKEAVVKQILKSALYIIRLNDGTEHRISKRNLELVKAYDPNESPFPLFTLNKVS